jgi:hypothetical protein
MRLTKLIEHMTLESGRDFILKSAIQNQTLTSPDE